ncbi:phosphosulfolactate synthase (CoM biosynthesis protein A) [Pseudochelatococcus lubricantis]|uniref:Phosphosulfolactate synthase (CoM biosynthesis protein A) n=1 Tax=Pseudochelatococcus lubricantis TaxID=1538102 RepID=A0ABX0V1C9_9HYPH|nr:phosphosulfolactate synthase [Pseudochelatococcus lubricantis]NIJ59006.1 phosphosulfolactate synthase (CoM biosynthesis protein A) [Pseudochelatococcus lubricantis]
MSTEEIAREQSEVWKNRLFPFVPMNNRDPKPRTKSITEIRGPYYASVTPTYLREILEVFGEHIDGFKFSGGSFSLLPEEAVRKYLDICHDHGLYVSTGGWIENVLARAAHHVDDYIAEVKRLGFDYVELSTGFIQLPVPDLLRLVEKVKKAGLKAKPEIGIQFGAGGDTSREELEAEGTRDPQILIDTARAALDAGADIIMIESEGITENADPWRTDVAARIMKEVGQANVMFEAADPKVFEWYIKNYGIDINLFVDHSQIFQLECLRRGVWGTKSTFGRITTHR